MNILGEEVPRPTTEPAEGRPTGVFCQNCGRELHWRLGAFGSSWFMSCSQSQSFVRMLRGDWTSHDSFPMIDYKYHKPKKFDRATGRQIAKT